VAWQWGAQSPRPASSRLSAGTCGARPPSVLRCILGINLHPSDCLMTNNYLCLLQIKRKFHDIFAIHFFHRKKRFRAYNLAAIWRGGIAISLGVKNSPLPKKWKRHCVLAQLVSKASKQNVISHPAWTWSRQWSAHPRILCTSPASNINANSPLTVSSSSSFTHRKPLPHDAPRWVIEPSRWLLLERGMLFRCLFVLRHRCCSSAATSRRHCMFQSSYSSP